ncbi:MAG: HD domain-containing phosphohydrolase [Armatimonadota bacterium]
MRNKQYEDIIQSNPIFYSLDKEIVAELASQLEEKHFNPDDIIVKEGDMGDSFYLILSGHVSVLKHDDKNEELLMAQLGPGDGFGEMSLFFDQPRSATIKAADEVTALELKRTAFKDLIEKYPQMNIQISRLIESRVSLLDSADQISKDKFRARSTLKIDLPLLDLLSKFNLAAGGSPQVRNARETAILADEMSKMLCPMVSDQITCAAYLYEIGKLSLSEGLINKHRKRFPLTEEEEEKIKNIYEIALNILEPFKSLKENIQFIKYLTKQNYTDMPLEAQILKVAIDFQEMINTEYQNIPKNEALKRLKNKGGTLYNPKVIIALEKVLDKFVKVGVENQLNFLKSMNIALDYKDHYTLSHSMHTRDMALKIAQKMMLSRKESDMLKLSSELHDIGKIYIKDEILNAPRKLTELEFDIMKQHPVWSAAFFAEIPGMEELTTIIRHHHEKYDGSGYPDRLKGDEIPLLSRIMALADVYSALTTERVYRLDMRGKKLAYDPEKALEIMEKMQPGQFDPELFKIFKEIILEEK